MSFFGLRKFPVPIVRPLWPFFIAGTIVFYGVGKLQDKGIRSEEYAKDPRNPYAQRIAKESHH